MDCVNLSVVDYFNFVYMKGVVYTFYNFVSYDYKYNLIGYFIFISCFF